MNGCIMLVCEVAALCVCARAPARPRVTMCYPVDWSGDIGPWISADDIVDEIVRALQGALEEEQGKSSGFPGQVCRKSPVGALYESCHAQKRPANLHRDPV